MAQSKPLPLHMSLRQTKSQKISKSEFTRLVQERISKLNKDLDKMTEAVDRGDAEIEDLAWEDDFNVGADTDDDH